MDTLMTIGQTRRTDEVWSMSDLCLPCRSIDLNAAFNKNLNSPPSWDHRESTKSSSCPLCRFFATLASSWEPGVHEESKIAYDLALTRISRVFIHDRMTTPCYLRVLAVRKPNSKSADQAHFLAPSRLEDPRRPGRGYARQRHSDSIDYGLLKTWIDDCQSLHPECSRVGNVHNPKDLTTLRYIDCKTREIVPAPEGASYVALSYVWGRSRPYNPESCGKYGSLPEILPAVIHDAIEVTLRLGFRHLWVDKYCIDQSDESDKYNQIAVMDKIYERAEVTVVAAAGEDSFYGLPGVSSRRRTLQPRFNFEEVVWVSCLRDPRILIHESKWSTRAWTYQEGIFSRRRLYFTEEQVYYECQRGGRTEVVEYCVHKGAHEAHFGTSAGPMEDADVYIRKFVDHVDMYTKRNLSWEGDIINGIRGILRSLCGPASPIFHCWGIPIARQSIHHTFVSGLRWKAETRMRRRNGFPSWSWVGWVGSANCPGTPYLDYSDDGTFCKIWFQRPDGSFEPSENCNPPNLGDRDPTALEVNPIIRISADILSLRFNEADVPSLHSNAYTPSRSFHGKILDLLSTPSAYIVNTRMHEKVIWYLSPTAQVSEDDELYREICEEELLGLRLGNFFICVVRKRGATMERVGSVDSRGICLDRELLNDDELTHDLQDHVPWERRTITLA